MRKLAITSAAIIVAIALTTATASAAVIVRKASTFSQCPPVSVSGNTVSGGCLITNVTGPVTINWAYTPQQCQARFDIRIDYGGSFYASDPSIHSCSGSGYPAMYKECENSAGVGNPWPGSMTGTASGITATMTMCHSLIYYPNENPTGRNMPFNITRTASNDLNQMIQTGPGVVVLPPPFSTTITYNQFSNSVFTNDINIADREVSITVQ